MEKCPIGFQFQPSKEEKIAYLLHKVKPFPSDDFISFPTIDIYGEKEPWEIFDDSKDDEIYFFSKLKEFKRIGRDGERYNRIVGKGKWRSYGNLSRVYDSTGEEIGFLNGFKYTSYFNAKQDSKWLLEECALSDEFKNRIRDGHPDYTFCSLKKNPEFVFDDQVKSDQKFLDQVLVDVFTASSSSACKKLPHKSRSFDLNSSP